MTSSRTAYFQRLMLEVAPSMLQRLLAWLMRISQTNWPGAPVNAHQRCVAQNNGKMPIERARQIGAEPDISVGSIRR